MDAFCYGLSSSTNKPICVGGESIVRLVVLSGVADMFQQMICLTQREGFHPLA